MWRTTVGGRRLTFHLAGINNENFIMRDDETGSWWQQVTGEAIFGPLAGASLEPVLADEVSFGLWRHEHPGGRVLVPDESAPWRRFSENWEAETAKMPVVTESSGDDPLPPRELVVGVKVDGAAKAYPFARLASAGVIVDAVGAVPVAVVLGEDGSSVRVFDRRADGRELDLFRAQPGGRGLLLDATTGSAWSFSGRAVDGALEGRQLRQLPALKDYWFDWRTYNPGTALYAPPIGG